ncbi:MAG: c-type cytochrome, partial [Anaerolineae bacterium]|nr:c-type cytochrome [Anaerolineae bacterium]
VVDPGNNPDAATLYESNCVDCHYNRIPTAESYEVALDVISTGGSHETMPVWGEVLTDEQIDALVGYTRESASGTSLEAGRILYVENCSSCHGDFGEGGPNPSKQGDIIAPISTAEYLSTRDDLTLRAIISQGQPNFGMSPFGLSFGGPLDTGEVDVMVKYLRSWQADPPVDLPPQVEYSAVALTGSEIYQSICSQCHGASATGGVGPSLRSSTFRWRNTQQDIFNSISEGHQATTMIAWGEILSSGQIEDIVKFIMDLPVSNEGAAAGEISFAASIKPIFDKYCTICHDEESAEGGYIATNYDDLINSGDNGPAVIPGDADASLLAIKLLGLQVEGDIMPPKRVVPEESIQMILDWIKAGAPNN